MRNIITNGMVMTISTMEPGRRSPIYKSQPSQPPITPPDSNAAPVRNSVPGSAVRYASSEVQTQTWMNADSNSMNSADMAIWKATMRSRQ